MKQRFVIVRDRYIMDYQGYCCDGILLYYVVSGVWYVHLVILEISEWGRRRAQSYEIGRSMVITERQVQRH